MKRFISLSCLPLILLAACQQTPPETPPSSELKYTTIDIARFEELSRQPGVTILDVRAADEFAQGHIRGAVNIDVGASDFAQKVAALNKNTTYLVQCRSGRRSVQACDVMLGQGFAHLYNLDGGITAWTTAGKPVEK
jgi:rhodanese-related sulfurtransferase